MMFIFLVIIALFAGARCILDPSWPSRIYRKTYHTVLTLLGNDFFFSICYDSLFCVIALGRPDEMIDEQPT